MSYLVPHSYLTTATRELIEARFKKRGILIDSQSMDDDTEIFVFEVDGSTVTVTYGPFYNVEVIVT